MRHLIGLDIQVAEGTESPALGELILYFSLSEASGLFLSLVQKSRYQHTVNTKFNRIEYKIFKKLLFFLYQKTNSTIYMTV